MHSVHVSQDGFSCSVCHTAHGMGASSPDVTGERLVNFDVNVVGDNGAPIAYNRGTGNLHPDLSPGRAQLRRHGGRDKVRQRRQDG